MYSDDSPMCNYLICLTTLNSLVQYARTKLDIWYFQYCP